MFCFGKKNMSSNQSKQSNKIEENINALRNSHASDSSSDAAPCSEFSQKQLREADRSISNRDVLITLLQDQLKQLEGAYKRNLDDNQKLRFQYCISEENERMRGLLDKCLENPDFRRKIETDLNETQFSEAWPSHETSINKSDFSPNLAQASSPMSSQNHIQNTSNILDKAATDLSKQIKSKLREKKEEGEKEQTSSKQDLINENISLRAMLALSKMLDDLEKYEPMLREASVSDIPETSLLDVRANEAEEYKEQLKQMKHLLSDVWKSSFKCGIDIKGQLINSSIKYKLRSGDNTINDSANQENIPSSKAAETEDKSEKNSPETIKDQEKEQWKANKNEEIPKVNGDSKSDKVDQRLKVEDNSDSDKNPSKKLNDKTNKFNQNATEKAVKLKKKFENTKQDASEKKTNIGSPNSTRKSDDLKTLDNPEDKSVKTITTKIVLKPNKTGIPKRVEESPKSLLGAKSKASEKAEIPQSALTGLDKVDQNAEFADKNLRKFFLNNSDEASSSNLDKIDLRSPEDVIEYILKDNSKLKQDLGNVSQKLDEERRLMQSLLEKKIDDKSNTLDEQINKTSNQLQQRDNFLNNLLKFDNEFTESVRKTSKGQKEVLEKIDTKDDLIEKLQTENTKLINRVGELIKENKDIRQKFKCCEQSKNDCQECQDRSRNRFHNIYPVLTTEFNKDRMKINNSITGEITLLRPEKRYLDESGSYTTNSHNSNECVTKKIPNKSFLNKYTKNLNMDINRKCSCSDYSCQDNLIRRLNKHFLDNTTTIKQCETQLFNLNIKMEELEVTNQLLTQKLLKQNSQRTVAAASPDFCVYKLIEDNKQLKCAINHLVNELENKLFELNHKESKPDSINDILKSLTRLFNNNMENRYSRNYVGRIPVNSCTKELNYISIYGNYHSHSMPDLQSLL